MTASGFQFALVYTEHKDAIYTYVLFRVGHNHDVAEDIVSEVFLKAYRNFASYDKRYAITTWLYTITRNTLIDHYRRGRVVVSIDDLPVADEQDALYKLITQDINEREVHEAIATLPAIQQEAIKGQFFEGKSAKELAVELKMSHDAVRKQVSRAMVTLREMLLSLCLVVFSTVKYIL